MRKPLSLAGVLLALALPLCGRTQQQESLADAARKARGQKKPAAKPGKVITNDDLPTVPSEVNVIGSEPAAPATTKAAPPAKTAAAAATNGKATKPEQKDEGYWRKRFAEARGKLRAAQKELDILQRELNLMQQQYYSDPNKALRQQYDRKDINQQTQAIEDKKKEVAQLKQSLSDLEDELRQAGGDPGWAREP